MIILLLLLPTLVLSTETLIDFAECANDTTETTNCFCLNEQGYLKHSLEKPYPCTKSGLRSKYFTEDSAVIQLQVAGDTAKNIGDEPTLMLTGEYEVEKTPKSVVFFGCKKNKKTDKIELFGDEIEKYRISLFEDRSRFEIRNVVCAVKTDRAYKLFERYDFRGKYAMIASFFTEEQKSRAYSNPALHINAMFTNNRHFNRMIHSVKCNPYSFKDRSFSKDFHVKPIMNRDRDVLNCENYNDEHVNYTMRYDHSKKKGIEMKELKCALDPSGSFLYSIVTETDEIHNVTVVKKRIEEQITSSNEYTFYCAAKLEESCENPVADCDLYEDPNCPTFNAEKVSGSPATLECPDNKWLIDGEYYQLEADPVCKRMKYSKANEAKFYAKLPSGNEVTLSGARCYTEYDCWTYSKLVLPVCNNEKLCGGVDTTVKNVLKCKDESKKLRIYSAENGETLKESSYKCNTTSGLWYNGDVIVREGSVVGCDKDIVHGEHETKFKRSSVVDEALPQLLKAIKTLLDTLTGVSGDSPNQSRLQYGTAEEARESTLAGAKQH